MSLFSIIVPIYNVEEYLPKCIDSIIKQSFQDFELILVDDGSPDSCPQICDRYAALDTRVKVIHKENGGLVSARKAGVAVASGKYICFVDGDDFIQEDMLETYANELKKKQVDIICASYTEYLSELKSTRQVSQSIPCGVYDKQQLRENVYPRMLSTSPFFTFYIKPSVCIKCINTKIVSTVYQTITENISLGEDAAVTYPALLYADSIAVIDYYGYYYRQNQLSMTHTYDKKLYDKLKALLVHMRAIESAEEWKADQQINEYTFYLLMQAANNEFMYNQTNDYRMMKMNMLNYLRDDIFVKAIQSVRGSCIKNKMILWCFNHKMILPIYLWYQKIRLLR